MSGDATKLPGDSEISMMTSKVSKEMYLVAIKKKNLCGIFPQELWASERSNSNVLVLSPLVRGLIA